MSHDVFISHSSRDKAVADGVCAALEGAGIRCWIAPRDLIAGKPFPGEIIRGIKSCRVMVLLFSSAANASPEVLREVQLATTHRLHLVNFRIEQSGVSDDLAYFLGVPHWLDALTQPMREHHARLIESVQALLAMDRPAPTPGQGASESKTGEPATTSASDGVSSHDRTTRGAGRPGELERRGGWVSTLTSPVAALVLLLLVGAALLFGTESGRTFWRRLSAESPGDGTAQPTPYSGPVPAPGPDLDGKSTTRTSPANPDADVPPGQDGPSSRKSNSTTAPTTPTPSQRGLVITGPVEILSTSKPKVEKEPEIEPAVEPPPEMKNASAAQPWENSLGMKFVRVPIKGGPTDGQMVWFSIYETRMQDYAAFWAENPSRDKTWKMLESEGPTNPVSMITWKDAKAFCAWLSQRERTAGTLPAGLRYRLPSDHEWSCAVGVTEDPDQPPMQKSKLDRVQFPWGKNWPPPVKAGNYPPIPGRPNDPFMMLAPVGSFDPNPLGLYDLGGNVAEFCEDADAPGSVYHILRGAGYFRRLRDEHLSSAREKTSESMSAADGGFRVIISGAVPKR